jgi:hypothetical protein
VVGERRLWCCAWGLGGGELCGGLRLGGAGGAGACCWHGAGSERGGGLLGVARRGAGGRAEAIGSRCVCAGAWAGAWLGGRELGRTERTMQAEPKRGGRAGQRLGATNGARGGRAGVWSELGDREELTCGGWAGFSG